MNPARVMSCLLALILAPLTAAQPDPETSTTSFTYQGRLTESGAPADGAYNLTFTLWDDPVAGAQIGDPFIVNDLEVAAGLFTVLLDFGAETFDNSLRWLEISVNADTLSPRTRVSPSPYAVQTRGIFVDEHDHVGIGTTTPTHTLDIEGDTATARFTSTDVSPISRSRLIFKRAVNAMSIFTGLGSIDFTDLNDDTHASITAGSLGAGSTSKLDISVGVANTDPQITITPERGVEFGPAGIRPPLAYAKFINNKIVSASDNILSITPVATGAYHVRIDGGFQNTDISLATLTFSGVATARVVGGSILLVNTYSFFNTHDPADKDFSLVVYRP